MATDSFSPTIPLSSLTQRCIRGDYAIVDKNNSAYIIQRSSNEVMHPSEAPTIEARKLYVEYSGLEQRLNERVQTQNDVPTLVVWDVGLGAAYNAMAVIRERESLTITPEHHALVIISFENDLDSFYLALQEKNSFSHLNHPAPQSVLKDRRWENAEKKISWIICEGDFAETLLTAPHADVVLYDLFSPKSNLSNWGSALFRSMYEHCNDGATFVTYSRATSVKASLLAAGFYVGTLPGIPPKEEHTIAWKGLPDSSVRPLLLTSPFLTRWRLSHKRFPFDVTSEKAQKLFSEQIVSHPQWRTA